MTEPECVEGGEGADGRGKLAKLVFLEEELVEMGKTGKGGGEGGEEVVAGPQSLQVDQITHLRRDGTRVLETTLHYNIYSGPC